MAQRPRNTRDTHTVPASDQADYKHCACGAITCTYLGWLQMSVQERNLLEGNIKSCQTCKEERLSGQLS